MSWRSCCCGGGSSHCGFYDSVIEPFDFGFQTLTGFTQVSGSWSISGTGDTSFAQTSDDFAALKMNKAHPGGSNGNRAVAVGMSCDTDGGQARLAFDFRDEDNYCALEIERISSTCYFARVIERSGGSDTIVGDDVELISTDLVVYYTPGNGLVRVIWGLFKSIWRVVSPAGSSHVAVATGDLAGGTASFSTFVFGNYLEPQLPTCNEPNCAIYGLAPVVLEQPRGGEPNDCDWDLTGSWSLSSGHNRTNDGTALNHFFDDSQDEIDDELNFYIGVPLISANDLVELWFDYLDSDNYHLVRLAISAGLVSTCKVYKVAGGTETEVADLTASFSGFGFANAGTGRPITICIVAGSCWISSDTSISPPVNRETIAISTTLHNGRQFGVKAVVFTANWFNCSYSLVNCTGVEDPERPCDCCEPEGS